MLVACSGGPDSVALAAVLHAVAKPLDLTLRLAHVNHGVRASAAQDEAVVLALSSALGIPVDIAAPTLRRADENTLRTERYAALAAIAVRAGASVVATGHQAEDQTETVLLALFRGAGPSGLAGIPARRSFRAQCDLVRPLLRFTRARLQEYALRAQLPHVVDSTNEDPRYRRNALRSALQALRRDFPQLDSAVARTAEVIGAELAQLPEAALRRKVRAALQAGEALDDVDFVHIEAAVRALQEGRSGRFSMGPRTEMAIKGGSLTVHRKG